MLFHKEVGFPDIDLPDKKYSLKLTHHVVQKSEERGIDLPQEVNFKNWKIFEIETTENGKVTKVCGRKSYNSRKDISIVVATNSELTLVTAWLNRKEDDHETLNRDKYDDPDKLKLN